MKNIIGIIILSLLAISCDLLETDNENHEYLSSDILPLDVGNYWEYQYQEFKDDSLIYSWIKQVEVISDTMINYKGELKLVYKIKEVLELSDYNSTRILFYLLGVEYDGVYWYAHSVDVDHKYYFNKHYHIKYPIKVGDNWIHDHDDYQIYFECASITDSVTYKNSKYPCISIKNGKEVTTYFQKYSVGIGLIEETKPLGWNTKTNFAVYKLSDYYVKK